MADYVKVKAFAPLDDPISGHVDPNEVVIEGEEPGVFETTQENARLYAKAQWAGPPGTSARDIQLEVAAREVQSRRDAKAFASQARQTHRNMGAFSFEQGHAGVVPGGVDQSVAVQSAVANARAEQAGEDRDKVADGAAPDSSGGEGSYEEMSHDELLAEAQARGIEVKGNESKASIQKKLEEDDKA